jgi:uncharacterized protein
MQDVFTRTWDSAAQLGPVLGARLTLAHSDPTLRPDASPAGLYESAQISDVSIVHGLWIKRLDAHIPVKTVQRAVELNPGKLLGFAGIDPTCQGWKDELASAVAAGMKGVTVSPGAQGQALTGKGFTELFAACQAQKLVVMVENRTVRLGQTDLALVNPVDLDLAACDFPDVKFVVSEAGFPWVEQAMLVALRRPNVFLELTSTTSPQGLENTLLMARGMGVDSKLLLASCYPMNSARQVAQDILTSGWPPAAHKENPLPRAFRDAIIARDSLSLLGIAKPAASAGFSQARKVVEKTIV